VERGASALRASLSGKPNTFYRAASEASGPFHRSTAPP